MTAEYSVEFIVIPESKLKEAEELIKKHDLDWAFKIETQGILQTQLDMSHSTISDIDDGLIPGIALLLKDTPQDGQLIKTLYDGSDTSSYFLFNGLVKEIPGDPAIIDPGFESFRTSPPVAPGEERDAFIHVKVLGLPGGKAAILEYNVKSQIMPDLRVALNDRDKEYIAKGKRALAKAKGMNKAGFESEYEVEESPVSEVKP